jgi:hypothetical protein
MELNVVTNTYQHGGGFPFLKSPWVRAFAKARGGAAQGGQRFWMQGMVGKGMVFGKKTWGALEIERVLWELK